MMRNLAALAGVVNLPPLYAQLVVSVPGPPLAVSAYETGLLLLS